MESSGNIHLIKANSCKNTSSGRLPENICRKEKDVRIAKQILINMKNEFIDQNERNEYPIQEYNSKNILMESHIINKLPENRNPEMINMNFSTQYINKNEKSNPLFNSSNSAMKDGNEKYY